MPCKKPPASGGTLPGLAEDYPGFTLASLHAVVHEFEARHEPKA
jgi:hypothetical protein